MSPKIVITGAGRAPSTRPTARRARRRPPASGHAGNPRERLRAKGTNWATAAFNSYQG